MEKEASTDKCRFTIIMKWTQKSPKENISHYSCSCKEEEALVLVALQYFILLPRKLQLTLLLGLS